MFRLIPLTQKCKSRLDIYFHFINKHHLLPSPKLIFMSTDNFCCSYVILLILHWHDVLIDSIATAFLPCNNYYTAHNSFIKKRYLKVEIKIIIIYKVQFICISQFRLKYLICRNWLCYKNGACVHLLLMFWYTHEN